MDQLLNKAQSNTNISPQISQQMNELYITHSPDKKVMAQIKKKKSSFNQSLSNNQIEEIEAGKKYQSLSYNNLQFQINSRPQATKMNSSNQNSKQNNNNIYSNQSIQGEDQDNIQLELDIQSIERDLTDRSNNRTQQTHQKIPQSQEIQNYQQSISYHSNNLIHAVSQEEYYNNYQKPHSYRNISQNNKKSAVYETENEYEQSDEYDENDDYYDSDEDEDGEIIQITGNGSMKGFHFTPLREAVSIFHSDLEEEYLEDSMRQKTQKTSKTKKSLKTQQTNKTTKTGKTTKSNLKKYRKKDRSNTVKQNNSEENYIFVDKKQKNFLKNLPKINRLKYITQSSKNWKLLEKKLSTQQTPSFKNKNLSERDLAHQTKYKQTHNFVSQQHRILTEQNSQQNEYFQENYLQTEHDNQIKGINLQNLSSNVNNSSIDQLKTQNLDLQNQHHLQNNELNDLPNIKLENKIYSDFTQNQANLEKIQSENQVSIFNSQNKVERQNSNEINNNNYSSNKGKLKKEEQFFAKLSAYREFLALINFSNSIFVQIPKEKQGSIYTAFIGKGNNHQLVKQILKQRWWWNITNSVDNNVNFVYTQTRNNNFVEIMKINTQKILETQNQKNKLYHENQENAICIYEEPQQRKMHNHVEGNYHLGNKKLLYYNMKNYFDLRNQDVFEYLPLTFHIEEGMQDPEYKRGKGIEIFDNIADINNRIEKDELHKNGTRKTYIIQQYLDRPLLYNKRKFDIRCYMLYTCYWYLDGYIRTSSFEFQIKNLDKKFIHLTNEAVQIKNSNFGKYEKGNKLSYEELDQYISQNYPGKDFYKQIYPKMKEIAVQTFRASYGKLCQEKNENNYELFGLDFMIDENYKLWLIEVNTNPCLEINASVQAKIIPNLMDNVFKLTIDPLFPPPVFYKSNKLQSENILETNKFELIFDDDVEKNQLNQLFKDNNENQEKLIKMIKEEEEEEEEEELDYEINNLVI
ncbi:hypothetical protein PPERSA_04934 [Pseudocohnilembus persalinus]|uniref:Tubulin-tyrosine ligase family protein n=1 Tax=Pseudocohnilembus persalinus TaxID=266149 RepID=A0A0V0R8G0_PSEPJ|nr:hypothetical protein PPERSA_04934 [Pseudocohnilembus persalinus]|eukprot:KRX10767.1 hypothetical protein PPERSA_04934 [Pseudocohnilembus persalinus]